MTTVPTGILFAHPDFDAGDSGLQCASSGRLELVTGADLVRQSLLMLLSTLPGERVMRPDYGCELLTLAFAQNDDTTAGLAVHYVRRAIERFEPRARILEITTSRRPESPFRLDITAKYVPRFGGEPQTLTVGLPLDGPHQEA
jgi:phage baseplate assembly protein W